jgi:hypothetical protein
MAASFSRRVLKRGLSLVGYSTLWYAGGALGLSSENRIFVNSITIFLSVRTALLGVLGVEGLFLLL